MKKVLNIVFFLIVIFFSINYSHALDKITVTTDGVNLRTGPDARVVKVLQSGEELFVRTRVNGWVVTDYGWVSSNFIKNEKAEVIARYEIINTPVLNFRRTPDGTLEGILQKGEILNGYAKSGDWVRVDKGWVHSLYLKEIPSQKEEEKKEEPVVEKNKLERAVIVKNGANLRVGPDARIVRVVPIGEHLYIRTRVGGWLVTDYGWISDQYTRVEEARVISRKVLNKNTPHRRTPEGVIEGTLNKSETVDIYETLGNYSRTYKGWIENSSLEDKKEEEQKQDDTLKKAVIIRGGANLRVGPDARIVRVVPIGEHLYIRTRVGGWLVTDYGWISDQYTRVEEAKVISKRVLNKNTPHRRTPEGVIEGTLNKSETVDIYETLGNYSRTYKGWIENSSLEDKKEEEQKQDDTLKKAVIIRSGANLRVGPDARIVKVLNKGEELFIRTKVGGWLVTDYGWISEKYVREETASAMSEHKLETSTEHRRTPDGTIEGTLSEGTTVKVYAISGNYARVYKGWILRSSFDKETARLYITTDGLNVRKGPSTDTQIITTIDEGEIYEFDRKEGNWYRLIKDGKIFGWIHSSYAVELKSDIPISFSLSSLRYDKNRPILINVFSRNEGLKFRAIVNGTALSNFTSANKFVWMPKSAGKYHISIEAIRSFDGKKTSYSEIVTLTEKDSTNTYRERLSSYTVEDLSKLELNRSTTYEDGDFRPSKLSEVRYYVNSRNFFPLPQKLEEKGHSNKIIIDDSGVNLWDKPNYSGKDLFELRYGDTYEILETTTSGWIKIKARGVEGYVNANYVRDDSKLTGIKKVGNQIIMIRDSCLYSDSGLRNVIGNLEEDDIYSVLETTKSTTKIKAGNKVGWVKNSDTAVTDSVPQQMFQFLNLKGSTSVSADQLDKILKGKGILEGQGKAFKEAGKKYNINEIYLISHSLIETGNGTSRLATGIVVEGKKVYNMFGVGAFDYSAEEDGSRYAYNHGWDTPSKAIIGGAEFISKQYVYNEYGQDTAYKMKYNTNELTHQYATAIHFAYAYVFQISDLYKQIHGYELQFEVPNYRN